MRLGQFEVLDPSLVDVPVDVPIADVGVFDPTLVDVPVGGDLMLGQTDLPLDYTGGGDVSQAQVIDLQDGPHAIASTDASGTVYTNDGLIVTSDGKIIDPNAAGGATVTWPDGTIEKAASLVTTDPASGFPISFDQLLRGATSVVDLANKVRQVVAGATAPTGSPTYIGNNQWRYPNGTVVTGTSLGANRFQLPDGRVMTTPAPAARAGLGGSGGLGLLALAGGGLFLLARRRKAAAA